MLIQILQCIIIYIVAISYLHFHPFAITSQNLFFDDVALLPLINDVVITPSSSFDVSSCRLNNEKQFCFSLLFRCFISRIISLVEIFPRVMFTVAKPVTSRKHNYLSVITSLDVFI